MLFTRTSRHAFALAFSLLAIPVSSCTDILGPAFCGNDTLAEIDALVGATEALATRTTTIETQVLYACQNIAEDLTGTRPQPTGSLDAQVQSACSTAATAIQNAAAGATVTFAYAAPICSVDAQAQLACEADCDVDLECTEGTVEVRCDPGDLSVVCSGYCEVGGVCEATVATPSVNCYGTCDGVCTGTCSGTTNAAGECTGTCDGTCEGNCTITSGSANVTCGGYARCRGGCSVTGTEPRCTAELEAPSCNVDAQCQAGCEATGSFSATCEPATVVVDVSGGSSATALRDTLEANLGVLLEVRDGLQGLVGDAVALSSTVTSVSASLQGSTTCALVQVNQLLTSANNTLAVVSSLQVTVSVSVSVTASAGTPAN